MGRLGSLWLLIEVLGRGPTRCPRLANFERRLSKMQVHGMGRCVCTCGLGDLWKYFKEIYLVASMALSDPIRGYKLYDPLGKHHR